MTFEVAQTIAAELWAVTAMRQTDHRSQPMEQSGPFFEKDPILARCESDGSLRPDIQYRDVPILFRRPL